MGEDKVSEKAQIGRGLKRLGAERAIRIASLNIRPGRAGRLEVALQALRQGNAGEGILQEENDGEGILQEAKLTDGIHIIFGAGYSVLAT